MPLNIKLLEDDGHLPLHRQITNSIRHAIGSGVLSPREQLPSVRELAAELEIAPNTVARAYQDLEIEGLVFKEPGRGTFVCDLIDDDISKSTSRMALFEVLKPAISSARAIGFSREEILKAVNELLMDDTIVVGFVGINQRIAEKWKTLLEQEFAQIGIRVEGMSIDDLRRDPEAALQRFEQAYYIFSLVSTYAETRVLLERADKKVLALITEMSMSTHQALAELPVTGPIGLICEDLYVNNILGLVSSYCELNRLRRVPPDDEDRIRALLRDVDVVLHTYTPADQIAMLAGAHNKLIHLEFLPNRACIEHFRELLEQYRPHLSASIR